MTLPIEFWSSDSSYGLRLIESVQSSMLKLCVDSKKIETGGILIGTYTTARDCAVVSEASPPPPDSRRGRYWFHRGADGLKQRLESAWEDEEYYLGEWHYHPGGVPTPSGTDRRTIRRISKSPDYKCPEPILIIIGGSFPTWSVGAYLLISDSDLLELRPLQG